MKPIEQLQEILCTGCKSVEKDVKELKFGCEFSCLWAKQRFTELDQWCIYINKWWELVYDTDEYWEVHCKIIWNPLSLKHLMMYCNESKIFIEFNSSWDYWTIIDWYEGFLWKYDITKELHEQEEETLVDIINFLKGV